jgi:hypothetical protein
MPDLEWRWNGSAWVEYTGGGETGSDHTHNIDQITGLQAQLENLDTRIKKRIAALADAATIIPSSNAYEGGKVTLGGNRLLATPVGTPLDAQDYWLQIKQDATGSRTLTLSSGYATSTDVPWTLSTAANVTDVARFTYDSTTSKWRLMELVHAFV